MSRSSARLSLGRDRPLHRDCLRRRRPDCRLGGRPRRAGPAICTGSWSGRSPSLLLALVALGLGGFGGTTTFLGGASSGNGGGIRGRRLGNRSRARARRRCVRARSRARHPRGDQPSLVAPAGACPPGARECSSAPTARRWSSGALPDHARFSGTFALSRSLQSRLSSRWRDDRARRADDPPERKGWFRCSIDLAFASRSSRSRWHWPSPAGTVLAATVSNTYTIPWRRARRHIYPGPLRRHRVGQHQATRQRGRRR